MSDITLSASMRSNLLSLRNISTQMDSTQLILASGKKVNSAIDNPNNYYQASSLMNRASDLETLLQGMEQGIQVIQAANGGLEKAISLLEQMEAIAGQAETVVKVPAKEYFEELVGANGAVVSTETELRDAIKSGKETICVYGAIDLDDITTTGGLYLKENQKLVGVGYFDNFDTETEKFSSITATDTRAYGTLISITQNNCLIDGLSLNYTNMVDGDAYGINIRGNGASANLRNLDILLKTSDVNSNWSTRNAIIISNNAICNIEGKINIQTTGNRGFGIYTEGSSTTNIYGKLSITTQHSTAFGIANFNNSTISIHSGAEIYFDTTASEIVNSYNSSPGLNILEIAQGAKLAFEKNGKTSWYEVQEDYRDENTSTSSSNKNYITADNFAQLVKVNTASSWQVPGDKDNDILINAQEYQEQFNEALKQYDMLINDSSYKGINLLKGESLKINFNETGEHNYTVLGKDISSLMLGLSEADWNNLGAVSDSIEALKSAVFTLRQLSENLGTQFNVIQTRINFTDAFTNILQEGADKLTLADMNEASAQYLTLQTRQQLAINSLSLASQAAQAILKLF